MHNTVHKETLTMPNTIAFSFYSNEFDDFITADLPAKWEICSNCEGEGKHSQHLGAITESERADWSDEELSSYFAGHYDITCECCKGSGKVLVLDLDALDADERKDVQDQLKENEDYARAREAEIRMGY